MEKTERGGLTSFLQINYVLCWTRSWRNVTLWISEEQNRYISGVYCIQVRKAVMVKYSGFLNQNEAIFHRSNTYQIVRTKCANLFGKLSHLPFFPDVFSVRLPPDSHVAAFFYCIKTLTILLWNIISKNILTTC